MKAKKKETRKTRMQDSAETLNPNPHYPIQTVQERLLFLYIGLDIDWLMISG